MLKIPALPAARRPIETDYPLSYTSVAYLSDVEPIGRAIDPRERPCPECPKGEALPCQSTAGWTIGYVCSAACGWSA